MTGVAYALLAGAGFAGAAGVALSAIAAHKAESASLSTAALLLVLHAAAVVALVAASAATPHGRGLLAGGWILLFGALLFALSVATLTLQGRALFPMSAPAGGSLMILGWLVVGLVALVGLAQR